MLKNVKIMMDESSRQSLEVLRSNFSEMLAPLAKINDFSQEISDVKDAIESLSGEVIDKINDLGDSLEVNKIHRNLNLVIQKQDQISRNLREISENAEDFKKAFTQINWDSPLTK